MIYTSHYYNQNIPDSFIKVGISKSSPYKVLSIEELFPSWDLINYYKTTLDEDGYTIRYYEEVLNKITPIEIINKIRRISMSNGMRPVVLMCHCGSSNFCHRHIISKWLRGSGFKIEEYYKY